MLLPWTRCATCVPGRRSGRRGYAGRPSLHLGWRAENIYGKRALQFDYWGIPDNLKGKDALYVRSDRTEYKNDLEEIKKYFDEVVEIEIFDYKFINGKSARKIICYYAKNYKGQNK